MYTVSLILFIDGVECEADALQDFLERVRNEDFDGDSIDIEREDE